MFRVDRGILKMHEPPDSTSLQFLCWPVLVYRVTAPLLRVRHLNIIEKVVLGLCRAGVRRPEEIAARIHQSVEFGAYVIRQLQGSGQLDASNAPTFTGLQTLATGRVDEEPELVVTHVFQDPVSGELWPRTSVDLDYQRVKRSGGDDAEFRLASAGHPREVSAYVVPCDLARLPSRPAADRIITAVDAHRRSEMQRSAQRFADAGDGRATAAFIAEQDFRSLSSKLELPSDLSRGGAVRRIVDFEGPVPEYLLAWLETDAEAKNGHRGWRARDPFGLDPDAMLHRLVTIRMREDEHLSVLLADLTAVSDESLTQRYRTVVGQVRRSAERKLTDSLGPEIRSHPQAFELLIGLEDAAARADSGGVETVAREAYRIYEHMFRRMVDEFAPPPNPSWAEGETPPSKNIVKNVLVEAAEELGFTSFPSFFLGKPEKVCEYPEKLISSGKLNVSVEKGFVQDLFPYALVAATDRNSPHRRDHPLRDLARRRAHVMDELSVLKNVRNQGSHATREATVKDDIQWCRGLALDAARSIMTMPSQKAERTAN
ncbi:hypothetical protein ACWDOR_35760 [Streptosporangium canum]|uniref:hypothetical protein n=1 Tax=Streptosporangium canum TaxID=324952 RepID=UPI0037A4A232